MTGDSRKKFDVFYRTLVSGTDQEHPRPKIIKLSKVGSMYVVCVLHYRHVSTLRLYTYSPCTKIVSYSLSHIQSNLFPERDTVFDYFFQKKGGSWCPWEDLLDRNATIPADAKVCTYHYTVITAS